MGTSIPYTFVTEWERRPWAMVSTGASPGDAERQAAATLRRTQEVARVHRPHYVIRKDPQHPSGLRAFDARSGTSVSPCFLMTTASQVRAWMTLNFPNYSESD